MLKYCLFRVRYDMKLSHFYIVFKIIIRNATLTECLLSQMTYGSYKHTCVHVCTQLSTAQHTHLYSYMLYPYQTG